MDGLKLFLKENKTLAQNEFVAVTKSLRDEKGDAVKWEVRHITTEEDERIREECTRREKGRVSIDYALYLRRMAVASVVFPPLYNASLQDSYDVRTPEDLLVRMVDNPGEYQEFIRYIQKMNGFDVSMEKRVEKAKNS